MNKHAKRQKVADLLSDITIELRARMARTLLMVSAVALSTGALLASVGISQNGARQIDTDLAASTINLVTVKQVDTSTTDSGGVKDEAGKDKTTITVGLPLDAEESLLRLPTVEAVGRRIDVSGITQVDVSRPVTGVSGENVMVTGISEGYVEASGLNIASELAWLLDADLPVAFVGSSVANTFGIPHGGDMAGVTISIDNVQYAVAGVIENSKGFAPKVAIPYGRALAIAGSDNQTELLIRTAPGAGSQISQVARLAVMPNAPERLSVSQVISTERVRDSVSIQLARQATWVGAFLLLLTVLLIANSMIVSVNARTTEIGVRRALGSSRRAVAAVFWCEGGVTGALGGMVGSAFASVVIVGVAAISGWTAHLSIGWILLGPIVGAGVGLVASIYPAVHASGIHPAIAVRSA